MTWEMLGTEPTRNSDNAPCPILGDDLGEIIDLFVDTVDLFKDVLCFGRRE